MQDASIREPDEDACFQGVRWRKKWYNIISDLEKSTYHEHAKMISRLE